jgi:hypothetical protein
MRRSNCDKLSDVQITQLEERRRILGLTQAALREKFDCALKATGCVLNDGALKARFNRVFNRRMRRPITEENKIALARALDWTVSQFDDEMRNKRGGAEPRDVKTGEPRRQERKYGRSKGSSARQIALAALAQLETYQIARGFDSEADNLTKVYAAAYRMFQDMRRLMGELPADEFARGSLTESVFDIFKQILNGSLRPHLTKWPERYEEWRKRFAKTKAGKKLSPQQLQKRFPQWQSLERDLKQVSKHLQTDARKLKSLILTKRKPKNR